MLNRRSNPRTADCDGQLPATEGWRVEYYWHMGQLELGKGKGCSWKEDTGGLRLVVFARKGVKRRAETSMEVETIGQGTVVQRQPPEALPRNTCQCRWQGPGYEYNTSPLGGLSSN